jgi:hypothetical protein
MTNLNNIKEFVKLANNKTIQIAFGILLFAGLIFAVGRATVDVPVKEVMCKDFINDNKTLSAQITSERIECESSKEGILKNLTQDLNASCADRVSEALESCEFSEELHCSICVARGVCK